MFCSECGAKAEGKFCSECGTPLARRTPPIAAPLPSATPVRPLSVVPTDWSDEIRYDVIVRQPDVRERIERHAKLAPKRMSGEDILGMYDKVASPNVSMQKLAGVAQPICEAL